MTDGERALAAARTALIVDPDADTRDLYAFTLGREHWLVSLAASGDEGYARAIELEPDVVVTELAMPGMDGFELCRRLRAEPATGDIPLIVVTASAFPRDVERATQAGGDVVISKPCLPSEFAALLARIVDRSRELRARSHETLDRADNATARSNALIEKSRRWSLFHSASALPARAVT